mgnify:CR=1 FL=1
MSIIATLDPSVTHELIFDLNISGTKDKPQDIRFIIEAQVDPETGNSEQDVFSIICRAVRSEDGVKVTIPRLLNLFRAGSYKSRLEVVLENRLFTPLTEEILIIEPVDIKVEKQVKELKTNEDNPDISVRLMDIVSEIIKPKEISLEQKEEKVNSESPFSKKVEVVNSEWRNTGFKSIKNPFKN